MKSLSKVVLSANEIPSVWIFEFYGELREKLVGQNLLLPSPLVSNQKTGSLSIFCNSQGEYKFRDHATGVGGGPIKFVSYIKNLDYFNTVTLIEKDFAAYSNESNSKIIQRDKYKIIEYKFRAFNQDDKEYWFNRYRIKRQTLDYFNVHAISSIIISNGLKTFELGGRRLYAYCTIDGDIFKLYKPDRKVKFLEFFDYPEGLDQFKKTNDKLIIQSSLKDIMSFYQIFEGFNHFTTNGEGKIISSLYDNSFQKTYSKKYVLLDNDEVGLKTTEIYKEMGYKPIYLPLSKDITQSISDNNSDIVKQIITEQL